MRDRSLCFVGSLLLLAACAPACGSAPQPPVAAAPQAPRSYQIIDATGAYLAFLEKMPSVPPEARLSAFKSEVVGAHPELFHADVIGQDPTSKDAHLDERLREYLPSLADRTPGIQRMARELRGTLGEQDATFRRAFPDMKWKGTVYFTASIDAFDGAIREVRQPSGVSEPSLLFGIDKIVKLYGTEARVGPLFHHELFHCYHLDVNPSMKSTEESHGMLEPLWSEGLAVYVASRLNPGATNRELTLSDEMVEAASRQLKPIAAEIRTQLDNTSEATYRDFFLGAGKRTDLPKRVAYYVGYRVAQVLATRHQDSLQELARLRRPELRAEVDEALAALE